MIGNVSRGISFLLLSLTVAPACNTPPAQTAATVSADICAGGTVASEALGILAPVVDVLRGGGADYDSTLDKIRAATTGATTMACVLSRALAHFTRSPSVAAPAAPAAEVDQADKVAAERARAYMAKMLSGGSGSGYNARPLPSPAPTPRTATEGSASPSGGR